MLAQHFTDGETVLSLNLELWEEGAEQTRPVTHRVVGLNFGPKSRELLT